MKRLIAVAGFTLLSVTALADYVPTNVSWRNWEISSSEDLQLGQNYSSVRYSLANLIDGRPDTAWVFRGSPFKNDDYGHKTRRKLSITIRSDKPFLADQIRLMNGYNKSRELYIRNNRVIRLNVSVGSVGDDDVDSPLKSVVLSDRMGWHSISLPHKAYRLIKLEFTRLVKGVDADTCISELELYDRGRKIDFGRPKVVMFTEGSECG